MAYCSIVVPLISECQRFERWSQELKPLLCVDGKPMIIHARDSFASVGDFQWVFILRPDLVNELRPPLMEWFPDAQIIVQQEQTLAHTLSELLLGPLSEDEVYICDADCSFKASAFFNRHDNKGDALLLGTRSQLKARLGTNLESKKVAALTSHPEEGRHTSCGLFKILNTERFLQFLASARDEDNAAELIKAWFHWGAKINWHEAEALFSFISRNDILQYKGRYGSGFHTLSEFYPYYLSEHLQPGTKILHFIGTSIGIICFISALLFWNPTFLLAGLVSGYAFAWISHMLIEHNRPATFKYPLYSFACDFIMFWELLTGKRLFSSAK